LPSNGVTLAVFSFFTVHGTRPSELSLPSVFFLPFACMDFLPSVFCRMLGSQSLLTRNKYDSVKYKKTCFLVVYYDQAHLATSVPRGGQRNARARIVRLCKVL
jgi:hypothetical protein